MSFQQGVSGLTTAGRNLEVIGHNVANASTVGFKSSRAEFADLYARASGSGGASVGLGAKLSAVAQQFNQGSLTATNNPLDVAINGAGFFQIQDQTGMIQYTRNGQFKVDRDGYVVNSEGDKLIAIPATFQTGQVPGRSAPLKLPTTGIEPKMTTRVGMEINLDSRAEYKKDATTGNLYAVDFKDEKTYNNSTSITVYDAKGQPLSMTAFFQRTGTDAWAIYVGANGESIVKGGADEPVKVADVTFASDGKSPVLTPNPLSLAIPASGVGTAAETTPMTVQLDLTGITQFGTAFGPTDVSQDGYPPGRLAGVTFDSSGTVIASYTSGQSAPLARVELANFRNPQGLQPVGGNNWAATFESGDAVLGVPGGGNLGLLQGSAVEESNADLTSELVNMMVAQRIYQANAQTIKTQDSVLQTLVNLR